MGKHKLGWIKPKTRPHPNLRYCIKRFMADAPLPPSVDLRSTDSPIYDQGQVGSCTGNGVADLIECIQPSLGTPSRLFIYLNGRKIEGTIDQDSGCCIHDVIQGVVTYGIVAETEWPYIESQFATVPPDSVYADAKKDLVIDYASLETEEEVKQCLAAGYRVVFGTSLFESFEGEDVAASGIVKMPEIEGFDACIGGHCMVIVGYNDEKQCYIVRNSWGTGWGDKGYCYIPYEYIRTYASDFWDIRSDMATKG